MEAGHCLDCKKSNININVFDYDICKRCGGLVCKICVEKRKGEFILCDECGSKL